jgi:hypothetical protein
VKGVAQNKTGIIARHAGEAGGGWQVDRRAPLIYYIH